MDDQPLLFTGSSLYHEMDQQLSIAAVRSYWTHHSQSMTINWFSDPEKMEIISASLKIATFQVFLKQCLYQVWLERNVWILIDYS